MDTFVPFLDEKRLQGYSLYSVDFSVLKFPVVTAYTAVLLSNSMT